MSTLLKAPDIRIAYKVTIWLLLSNNIAGIALNFEVFILSLVLIWGIPGGGFTIHYFISALRKEPTMVALLHLSALVYNIVIWNLLEDSDNIVIGGEVWPSINIGLSTIAFALIIINLFLTPPHNNEN